jgi:hypothetical protein
VLEEVTYTERGCASCDVKKNANRIRKKSLKQSFVLFTTIDSANDSIDLDVKSISNVQQIREFYKSFFLV